jgi:dienelactone hydrolase
MSRINAFRIADFAWGVEHVAMFELRKGTRVLVTGAFGGLGTGRTRRPNIHRFSHPSWIRELKNLGCLLPWLSSLSVAAALDPGQVHRVNWSGAEKSYIRISVPAAATENRPLPILFWFHGTGGQPSIIFGHGHQYGRVKNEGRYGLDEVYRAKFTYIRDHLIVVGMSYPKRDAGAAPFPIERIWESCRQVRDWLDPQVSVDKSRCYMGGFSRGGNNSFLTSIRPPPDLAGIAMFAGGVPSGFRFDPDKRYPRPFHVLLGLGEWDSNFWAGHIAHRFFQSRGATVTYDEWLNHGHGSIELSRRVLDWFELRLREKEPSYRVEVTRALLEEYAEVESSLQGWQRFLALREMLGDPRLSIADPRMRLRIQSGMRVLVKRLDVAGPYREYQAWSRQVNREIDLYHYGNVTEQALLHLLHGYRQFSQHYPDGVSTRNTLQAQARVMHYLEIGMFNKSEQALRYDDGQAQTSAHDQLEERLASLEKQLKEAERERVNQGTTRRDDPRNQITLGHTGTGGRAGTNALKLQMQQVRTQLAALSRKPNRAPVPRTPPPMETYDSLTEADRTAIAQQIKTHRQTQPIDRFSLRSGPTR